MDTSVHYTALLGVYFTNPTPSHISFIPSLIMQHCEVLWHRRQLRATRISGFPSPPPTWTVRYVREGNESEVRLSSIVDTDINLTLLRLQVPISITVY